MADERLFKIKIISPDRLFYEGDVDFVEFVTSEGEVGIYKNHEPMTVLIVPGVLKLHNGEKHQSAAIHGGFAEILAEEITMLVEVAEWPEEIDVNRAEEAKARAIRRIKTGGDAVDSLRAEASLRRSLARLEASGDK